MDQEIDRTAICGGLWGEAIDFGGWIDAYLNSNEQRDAGVKATLQKMLDAGIKRDAIREFAEAARYEATFSTLRILAENCCYVDEADCLYEDLLTSKPE